MSVFFVKSELKFNSKENNQEKKPKMHARYVAAQLKQNAFFLTGLAVGLYIALVCIPMDYDDACSLPTEATSDDYEPRISPNIKQLPNTQVKNIQRPRYYSTELGIKDKLFIGVMSSEENINLQATAINKTIAHLTNKIKFFITANMVKDDLNLGNVVGFTDKREMLRPFHALKYIADNFLEEYDYFFFTTDVGFINGRKLSDVVNKISVSEDVYMGTIGEGDSHYCNLDTGVLLSNSVLKAIHSNLDWCVRNSYSPQHFENIGRCILHSTSLKCEEEVQGQRLGSMKLSPGWKYTPALADVVSAYPVDDAEQTYKLHAYVSRIYLERTAEEIISLRSSLVTEVHRNPPGYRNTSWPGGLTGDGLPRLSPETRFDHLRWTSFNESHAMLSDDHHAVTKLTGATKKAIELVLEASWSYAKARWENLEPAGLVEGQWLWDPARSLNYLLLLRLRDKDSDKHILKRLEACKPLGETRILPVPYVTESSKISMVLPVLPKTNTEPVDWANEALGFLARFKTVCLNAADKSFLLLVLLYTAEAPNRGSDDPYDKLKKEALSLSQEFKDSGGKVEWLSIRLPSEAPLTQRYLLRVMAMEVALGKLPGESLVLWTVPDVEFSQDALNRVRMNTIQSKQVFSPIPFVRYDQYLNRQFVDDNGSKPQTNTGHFDERFTDIMSFYRRDYETLRSQDATLPQIRSDSDINLYLMRALEQNQLFDYPLKLFLASQLHILRAPEPGVIVRPRPDPPCVGKEAGCLSKLKKDNFRTLSLGARGALAKLLLQTNL